MAARLARFDGVLLPGGGDLAPYRYGAADTHDSVYDVDDLQDAFDLEVARQSLDLACPCSRSAAACRSSTPPSAAPCTRTWRSGPRAPAVVHPMAIQRGPLLEQATGAEKMEASCYHHQRVDRVGAGLTVTARAADGTVEGLELPGFSAGSPRSSGTPRTPPMKTPPSRACSTPL